MSRVIHAPRGSTLTCKGWQQEAAYRMLQNNLDPEVAERPEDLVVYGGRGQAARNWEAFDAILDTLKQLEDDETLLVQSGKPVVVFRSHPDAPRVLIANSNLVPQWATQENFDDLAAQGLIMYGQMTAGSWIYIGTQGILQGTYETLGALARSAAGARLQRQVRADRRPGRDGRRAAAGRHHERRRGADRRGGPRPRRAPPGDRLRGCRGRHARRGHDAGRRGGAAGEPRSIGLIGNAAEILPRTGRARRHARCGHRPNVRARLPGLRPGRSVRWPRPPQLRRDRSGRVSSATAPGRWPARCEAMLDFKAARRGGLRLRQQPAPARASTTAWPNAFDYPGFVPAYIRPLFCEGKGPFRWVALSGDPEDIYRTDEAVHGTVPRGRASAPLADAGARAGQLPGAAGAHLLAGLRRARPRRAALQRAGGARESSRRRSSSAATISTPARSPAPTARPRPCATAPTPLPTGRSSTP